MEHVVGQDTTAPIQKPKKGEYDEAFDSLAAFLFEQYKKKKQAEIVQDGE